MYFNKITSYEGSPANQAIKYSQNGFNDIHIVDLDGALQGQTSLILLLLKNNKKVNQGFKLEEAYEQLII